MHVAQTTNVAHLQNDIVSKLKLNIGEIQKLINNKKKIFCKTHINSCSGNIIYVTEYIKKSGRVIFATGQDKKIGQYFISLNLINFFDTETIRIYTSLPDWEVEIHQERINVLLVDLFFTIIYFGIEDIDNKKISDNLTEIYAKTKPFVITKEHLKLDKFKDQELFLTEISAFPPSLRRLPEGWAPSDQALQLAEEYNWEIPDGYTFVREFEKRVYKKN